MNTIKSVLLFIAILLLSVIFRFYGVNWDENQHLHPDERFLTMVAGAISWPAGIYEYLSTSASPLNPHNRGHGFFVYGTFPVFFTKYMSESFKQADYNGVTLVGRKLSALFDLGTVAMVFLIAREMLKSIKPAKLRLENSLLPHLAMFFYATAVLPIQLSHFYAVDTYLTFFICASFYFLLKLFATEHRMLISLLMGITLGLAVASKISAVYFFPVIGLGLLFNLFKVKKLSVLTSVFVIFTVGFFTVRFAQPYLFADPNPVSFTLNPKILENWKQLKSFDNPDSYFPPGVQWIKTRPYIFPLKNLLFWGMGFPLGLISFAAVFFQLAVVFHKIVDKKFSGLAANQEIALNLSLLWIIALFIYQGGQFVKALRYFFPIYPFLVILSAWFILNLINQIKDNFKLKKSLLISIFIVALVYPLSFVTIYGRPHTRIAASNWTYLNIPQGSVISAEVWDDALPISLPGNGLIREKYKFVEYPLYFDDIRDKWLQMDAKLKETDYIFLTSNRLYGSIMTAPEKYPVTYRYYQALFDGSLGFAKIAEFTSRPNLEMPFAKICLTPPFARYGIVAMKTQECDLSGISFVDDYADETFTVYDHPKVLIFKKVRPVDYLNLLYAEN